MEKDRMRQDYKAKLVLTEQQYNQRIVSLTNVSQYVRICELNFLVSEVAVCYYVLYLIVTEFDNGLRIGCQQNRKHAVIFWNMAFDFLLWYIACTIFSVYCTLTI